MLPILTLCLLNVATAQSGNLIVLDTGVGHRSTPIPRWGTSLRSLRPSGTNASILQSFGSESTPEIPAEPVYAYSLAYTALTKFAYLATGQGIIRTELDIGRNEVVVPNDEGDMITTVTVSQAEGKIYFSTLYTGLIKSANLDGSHIQLIRNVSQGLDFSFTYDTSYTPAKSYADGILVDSEKGWLYWSASNGTDGGSIRRVPFAANTTGEGDEQVLAIGLNKPGQLRLVRDTTTRTNSLWWTEKGQGSSSSTCLKLVDLYKFAELPSSKPLSPPVISPIQTMIHSDNSSIFFEVDATGEKQMLSIQSFVVYRDGFTSRVWFVAMTAGRTVFGKLIEMTWQGSGEGRKAVLKVLNQDTGDLGVPVGLEYVP